MDEKLIIALSADIKQLQAKLKEANGLLKGFGDDTRNESDNVKKDFSAMGTAAKYAATAIAGAFAFNQIKSFGQDVINTTAEFQKFEAVLSNTLGSNSAAQTAMKQISDFAAKTPFQVNELTGAFVKLANQGFVPTETEMRKLGDLASSTGKSFDQLVEAILDAQVSEYERLKEFGVRANDMGDKVQFTFKGVKTVVDKTSESIRAYILGLGDLNGVSGSMAKISTTLGGRLSNLSDSFTQLQKNIGDLNSGALYTMVELLSKAVGYFTELTKTKLTEQKLGIGVTIDREESDRIINEFNAEIARIGEIKDVSKLQEHMKFINTNLQFFQQAMVKETDSHARDVQFAYYNMFKEARNVANGQMNLLLSEINKKNQKLADSANEARKKAKEKEDLSTKMNFSINADPNANVDLSSLMDGKKEISDYQAQINMLTNKLVDMQVIGGNAVKTITDNIVVSTEVTKQKLTEVQMIGQMVASQFASNLGSAFASVLIDGENFGDAMAKVFQQLGRVIIAEITRMLVLKAIFAAFGGPLGVIGSNAATTGASALLGGRIATNVNSGLEPMGGSVELVLRGNNLVGSLNSTSQRNSRTR